MTKGAHYNQLLKLYPCDLLIYLLLECWGLNPGPYVC